MIIMVHSTGIKKNTTVTAVSPPSMESFTMSQLGMDSKSMLDHIQKAQRMEAAVGNAERPSNLWYKMTERASYWYMYALMDWYKSEVSILSTVILRSVSELFRYDLVLRPRFVLKCDDCGYEAQSVVAHCPKCGSARMRQPDWKQTEYFKRPNGKSFLDEANNNGQSLKDVLKAYAESQYLCNQSYTICVTGDVYDPVDGHLLRAYPLEFICEDPKFVRYLYDETGTPGTRYAFTRDNRNSLIDLDEDPDALNMYSENGKELYPAYWKVGQSYGGTGKYWVYTEDEVYQDHWFRPSLIYGVPIWYDIEDDLLTYHYIEKHFLKRYKFGYVRKMIILPGFNDEDVEDITKGIQDILATNDNSIPIVCTPPQMPNTAEMKAQTLELGTEDSSQTLQYKDDIRDRICAHAGVPNLFAGDVEQSGGMNNESQQITVYDRYLLGAYSYIDRQCAWILSWFPLITDFELTLDRPTKSMVDVKKRVNDIEIATRMKQLGFDVFYQDGEFVFSEEPVDQVQRREQEAMMKQQMAMQQPSPEDSEGSSIFPGDGEGPPERGTARREDEDIGETKDEVDLSKREADDAMLM